MRWLAALALTAVLAGCGGSVAGGDAQARTIRDAKGRTVEVPARPGRVLALSEPTLDAALALGLTPVGTTAGRGQSTVAAYLGEKAKGIESVGILGQPNLERVAGLEPDLILIDGTSIQDGAIIDKLEKLAPTVYVSRTGEDWRTAFAAAADALGRAAQGKEVLAAHDARVADIRGRLGANGRATVSVVRWSGIGLPETMLQELAASRVLRALGLRRPALQAKQGPGHGVPISLEQLDVIDGDWLFLGALGAGGPSGGAVDDPAGVAASRAAIAEARRTPGFTDLRAVEEGHVVPVDGSAWTSAGGVLAEEVVLDDVERTLVPGGAAR